MCTHINIYIYMCVFYRYVYVCVQVPVYMYMGVRGQAQVCSLSFSTMPLEIGSLHLECTDRCAPLPLVLLWVSVHPACVALSC